MWDTITTTVAGWFRFYASWIELQYNSFGPRMYGYLLAVVLVFGIYLLKEGPRRN